MVFVLYAVLSRHKLLQFINYKLGNEFSIIVKKTMAMYERTTNNIHQKESERGKWGRGKCANGDNSVNSRKVKDGEKLKYYEDEHYKWIFTLVNRFAQPTSLTIAFIRF